jgi:biopolymer transport protein ExbB/TolQ
MKQPRIALALMIIFTVVVAGVGVALSSGLSKAFLANSALNSVILAILVFGIFVAFIQISRLQASIGWLSDFRANRDSRAPLPTVLTPLTPALGKPGEVHHLPMSSMRAMLDSVYSRLDEGRETSRYLMNTLILLGLLGTFWGLLQTVSGIGSVIGDLNVGDGDLKLVFDTFKEGLRTPLVGMGISFSASLFGLASSLVLGFYDLTTGRVQNRFCEELEDWLTTPQDAKVAELSPVATSVTPPRYQDAFIQNLSDQLERLQKIFRQQEQSRESERASVRALSEGVSALDDHLKSQQHVLVKLAEIQAQVSPVLSRLNDKLGSASQETIEAHTRRIDLNLKEIGEQVSRSADTVASELREELKIIAKILASEEAKSNA